MGRQSAANLAVLFVLLIHGATSDEAETEHKPYNITLMEGESATLPCGAKEPGGRGSVSWFKGDVAISTDNNNRLSLMSNGTLHIYHTGASDTGAYKCEVGTYFGFNTDYSMVYLEIQYRARVTKQSSTVLLTEGQPGIIPCHSEANPPVTLVKWTKDSLELHPYEMNNSLLLINGSLLLKKVNSSHRGRYTCLPSNVHGSSGNAGEIEVNVQTPPQFLQRPQNAYKVRLGNEIKIPCNGRNTDENGPMWKKHNDESSSRYGVRKRKGNVIIPDLQKSDLGFYHCVISNQAATLITTTLLADDETASMSPNITDALPRIFSIHLQWLPGYTKGLHYKQVYDISYRKDGTSAWKEVEVDPPGGTSDTLDDLEPGTKYYIRIVGTNSMRVKAESQVVTATTQDISILPKDAHLQDSDVDPAAPRNLTLTKASDGLWFSWLPPASKLKQTKLIRYRLEYRKEDEESVWKAAANKKKNETTAEVNFLQRNETYLFRVFALYRFYRHSSNVVRVQLRDDEETAAGFSAIPDNVLGGIGGALLFLIIALSIACVIKLRMKRRELEGRESLNMEEK